MPHIHTGPGEHDSTASAYIVRLDMDEPRLLLHMHKKLKVLMQIGGHIELTNDPWQTVLEEIGEESGYQKDQLQLLQPLDRIQHLTGVTLHPNPVVDLTHEFSPGHFHDDTAWAFVTNEPPREAIAAGESEDIRFLSATEIRGLTAGQIPENIKEIGIFVLENCVPNWERIKL